MNLTTLELRQLFLNYIKKGNSTLLYIYENWNTKLRHGLSLDVSTLSHLMSDEILKEIPPQLAYYTYDVPNERLELYLEAIVNSHNAYDVRFCYVLCYTENNQTNEVVNKYIMGEEDEVLGKIQSFLSQSDLHKEEPICY